MCKVCGRVWLEKTSAKVEGTRGKTERGLLSVVFSLFVGARHVSPLFSLLTPENFADFSLRFYFSLFTDRLIRRNPSVDAPKNSAVFERNFFCEWNGENNKSGRTRSFSVVFSGVE